MADWKLIAARKKEEQRLRIPREWQLPAIDHDRQNVLDVPRESRILTANELRLTEDFDATALQAGLAAGVLTSVDVVTAFCKRAAIAQQLTCCLTEIFFDEALERARQLDEHFARAGKPKGPLHGLPISLKDTFKVKGYDASIGVAAFCFKPATANSALVDLLLDAGAVLYCKTNVPQTLAALDSHNNVFGRTLNPANKRLTPGGSSGGEGALLGMRGSVLGIGTDVGGSIRIPALCNGLYGLKPSHGRVPYAGQESGGRAGDSKLGIEATAGPIARSVRDCELFLRVVSEGDPSSLDPEVVLQNWDQQEPLRSHSRGLNRATPLRVGVARTDGHCTPLPPMQRLIDDIARTLSTATNNIEIIEVELSSLGPQCLKVFNGVISIDGANTWFDTLEEHGEPLSPWLQNRLRRRPGKSLDEVRKIQAQKIELQTKFLEVWRETGGYWRSHSLQSKGDRTLDVILCPAVPHPVPAIDSFNSTNYTSMFNLLDLSTGMIPVRDVTEADLGAEIPQSQPLNGWDKINRELWTKVDRKVYLGSALSVQIVTPRLTERKLVESMSVLDEALRPLKKAEGNMSKL